MPASRVAMASAAGPDKRTMAIAPRPGAVASAAMVSPLPDGAGSGARRRIGCLTRMAHPHRERRKPGVMEAAPERRSSGAFRVTEYKFRIYKTAIPAHCSPACKASGNHRRAMQLGASERAAQVATSLLMRHCCRIDSTVFVSQ